MKNKSQNLEEKNQGIDLITINNPQSIVSEAFRTLRANFNFAAIDQPFRTIMVTSGLPKDGKSTVVANLATVTAQAGKKVILVDCDLRKPVQHRIFNLPNIAGLTNCILNNLRLDQAAQTISGLNLKNLKILTCGPIPPNPVEILSSERTKDIWASLKNDYDYVFIDSPPVIEVADASILASQVDAVLIVVRQGTTRIEIARRVKEQLLRANARIIGVVLNEVKMRANQYYPYGQ